MRGKIMKIINIKKIGKNKYEFELANKKIKTYDTIILKYQLLLKKEISEELLQTIEEETKIAEIYEKTLQFIGRKLRSKKEVIDFLKKQEISIEEQTDIIDRLTEQGLFDEKAYIEAFIHDRMNFSSDGPNKIKEELLKNEFDLELILIELEKLDEKEMKEKLNKLIVKKLNANHKYSENYCKQKITEQMLLLGYPKEMIEEILDKENFNHESILENEARKLYEKYKNKKNGNELYLFLKQKLYQKRYPIEDINDILEKIKEEEK